MPRNFGLRLLLPCVLMLLASACNSPTPSAPAVDTANAHPIQSELADTSPAEEARGQGYEFHIRYPELAPKWKTLSQALRSYAALRKQQFLSTVPPVVDRAVDTPVVAVDLEFDVARRTEDFISVLARETTHSGADAARATTTTTASFVLHAEDAKLLSIADLFSTPDAALWALSDECQRQIEGRYEAALRLNGGDAKTLPPLLKSMRAGVEHGTAARAANFTVFLIDGIDSKAIGLTLIFAQAQLAASDGGEQQVEVPAKVFYDLLKPEYRDAFSVDTEELKRRVH